MYVCKYVCIFVRPKYMYVCMSVNIIIVTLFVCFYGRSGGNCVIRSARAGIATGPAARESAATPARMCEMPTTARAGPSEPTECCNVMQRRWWRMLGMNLRTMVDAR